MAISNRDKEIARCLRDLATLLDTGTSVSVVQSVRVVSQRNARTNPSGAESAYTFTKPKRKSAKADTVNRLLSSNKLLKSLGAKSKGVDIERLAQHETSQYYMRDWKRQSDEDPNGPASDRLMKVLHARQRELGVTFKDTTRNFTQLEADQAIEALKSVGRALLGARSLSRDTCDPLVG